MYSGGAWTSKTDVLTNDTKGITGAKISFDENTNEIYAVYTARTTAGTATTGNVYWKKSADGMASWGTEQGPVNTTAGDLYGARANIMSDERIYVSWDLVSADDLLGNTIVDITLPDTTAPAAVSDLALSSPSNSAITVSWTAPGDDNSTGTATSYDLRYSTSAITAGNFSSATAVTGEPTPSVAGSAESLAVTGLSPSTTYYFAIKTSDEVPNTSAISNLPSLATTATPDTTAPSAVSDLAASNPSNSAITLSWTAPGDDAGSGTASSYDIRYSTSNITDGNWSSATQASGESTPLIAGTSETISITGLTLGTTYYFAIKTSDEVPNTSALSNISSLATTATASSDTTTVSTSQQQLNTVIKFYGRAYPGATVTVLAKSGNQEVPLKQQIISAIDGSFGIEIEGTFAGYYSYGLKINDKDGRAAPAKFYDLDLSLYSVTDRDIFVPPTLSSTKQTLNGKEVIMLSGYATPKNDVRAEIDGKIISNFAIADSAGFYKLQIDANNLSSGSHIVRVRQIDNYFGKTSDWSLLSSFIISAFGKAETDFNADGIIDIKDWSIFLSYWGKTGNERMRIDLNGDSKIDISDFSLFITTFKKL